MNWVLFWVLLGLFVFNFIGVAIYHYEWKRDNNGEWKNNKGFWKWTICLLLFGIAYVVLRVLIFLRGLFAN